MSDETKDGSQPVSVEDVATVVVKLSRRVKKVEKKLKRIAGESTDVIGFRLQQDDEETAEQVPEELKKRPRRRS